jgi:hypothetical protein
MHSYDPFCADVCPAFCAQNWLGEQGLRSNGILNFFAGLSLLSLRKGDAILSREWREIHCQLAARTRGQCFRDAYCESSISDRMVREADALTKGVAKRVADARLLVTEKLDAAC